MSRSSGCALNIQKRTACECCIEQRSHSREVAHFFRKVTATGQQLICDFCQAWQHGCSDHAGSIILCTVPFSLLLIITCSLQPVRLAAAVTRGSYRTVKVTLQRLCCRSCTPFDTCVKGTQEEL